MKEKRIFQKTYRKRDFAISTVNKMTANLRALLLLSKSRELIFPFIGTKVFKNPPTLPKYQKHVRLLISRIKWMYFSRNKGEISLVPY